MKKVQIIIPLFAIIALIFSSFSAYAAIDLAPVAEGMSGKHFVQRFVYPPSASSYSTTTSFTTYSSINGAPNNISHTSNSTYTNFGPFIRAGRFISTAVSYSPPPPSSSIFDEFNIKGIIEFDISSLSSLTTPVNAILNIDFYKLNISSNIPATVAVYDMAESTEDGSVTGNEIKGNKIADLFTIPTTGNLPSGIYSVDVSAAVTADLLNIGSNSYSGFIIDYDVPDPSFPLHQYNDVLGEVLFNNYDAQAGEGPTLTVSEQPIPEPASLILIGSGLIGIYITTRRLGK